MADYEYIKNIAFQNIWCAPDQDRQYIFKPFRLSRKQGVTTSQGVMGYRVGLPVAGVRFHVYQIASIPTSLLHLEKMIPNTWTRVDTFCRKQNMIVDLYTGNGIHYSRGDAWLAFTDDKTILLAIQSNLLIDVNLSDGLKLDDLINSPLYIRFYTNAFFTTTRGVIAHDIDVYCKAAKTSNDLLTLGEFISTKQALSAGKVYGYINGKCYPTIRAQDYVLGDYVELIYDSSITSVVTVSLSSAPDFESTLDSMNKFLINPQLNSQTIRYFDDLDFYLGKGFPDGSWRGCYVHRNEVSNVRMLTHDVFSLSDPLLSALRTGVTPIWADTLNSLQIKIVIRDSGFARPLVAEHTRLNEMYRLNGLLDHDLILKEPNISLAEWQFANLEASDYTKLMSLPYGAVTNAVVARTYGYYPLSRMLGDGFMTLSGGQATLAPALRINSTVFEYDANGLLLGYYTHASGDVYSRTNSSATMIEAVTGVPGHATLAVGDQVLEHDYEYRFYLKSSYSWADVTDAGAYTITPGATTDQLNWVGGGNYAIVTDKFFPLADNTYVSGLPALTNGFLSRNGSLYSPLSDVDVWLNGHPLVEGIDYHVKWPEVGICTKAHWKPLGQSNRVIFRARGLQSGNVRKSYQENGLIMYGLLSNNEKEDFHGDQNLKISANGRLYNPDSVHYVQGETTTYLTGVSVFHAEDARLNLPLQLSGNTILTLGISQNHPLNGKPYSIRDTYVSLKRFVRESTVSLRERSIDWDRRMRDWVTENRTIAEPTVPNAVAAPYELYSPFLALIIKSLINYEFPGTAYRKEFLDLDEVLAAVEPWAHYRAFDPTTDAIWDTLDHQVISIHAHPYTSYVEVDVYQMRLLEFISTEILKSRVDVSKFIKVSPTTAPAGQW